MLCNLSSFLNWLCFENPDAPNPYGVAPDRVHPGRSESCCLKKRSPFTLAALFAADDGEHVEIAHQAAF